LKDFVYGIPEIHREEMKKRDYVSSAGCNATAVILALYPLYKEKLLDIERTVAEVKTGSSEGGAAFSAASHHPERSGSVRSYSPTGHRHTAEIIQELSFDKSIRFHLSATSIEMVRGVLATCHVFLNDGADIKAVWKAYRAHYSNEPFIRFVMESKGIYRFPEPKLMMGTNFCDIGFELEETTNRLVVISAIDNLMKGAAGQAVQAFNIMNSIEETSGLEFSGLHPI
jgi:N-acetyl-gamma-glutamyl-phosphate/LysW-gamma-L-alpha-aminoadipyl-6-phosphate reductase